MADSLKPLPTVNADSPWQTFDEFVDYTKKNPGEIRVGVTLGGIPHVQAAMIEDAANLSFRYVGFEGTGARIRSLVGGNIDAAIGARLLRGGRACRQRGDGRRRKPDGAMERHPRPSPLS